MVRLYKDKKGYKHFANSGKAVHQYVAEQKLGRKLRPGEVIHHKNRVKTDNRRSNLRAFPNQQAHYTLHVKAKRKYGRW